MVALSSLGGSGSSGGGLPKVFFNGTLTSSDLTGNDTWTLFTNDATTTSVIESVRVEDTVGPFLLDGTLTTASFINDTVDIGKTVNLSGTEITAPSTSITVKLDTPLELANIDYYADGIVDVMIGSNNVVALDLKSNLFINRATNFPQKAITDQEFVVKYFDAGYDGTIVSSSETVTTPTMSSARWYYEAGSNAYYFYSDGNYTCDLFHATIAGDGSLSSWTLVADEPYAYQALDIEEKKSYYTDNGNIYVRDLVTNIETQIATGISDSSTASTAGAVNGVVFIVRSSSYLNYFTYYDTNENSLGTISLSVPFSVSTNSHLGVCYNPDENKYYVSVGFADRTDVYSIDWESKTAVHLGDENPLYPNDISNMNAMLGNDSGQMFIHSNTANLQIIKFANDTLTVQEDIADIGGYSAPYLEGAWYRKKSGVKQTATLEAVDYEINLKCKVSGTEYKEG